MVRRPVSAGRNDAGIDAGPVETTHESRVLDLDATVHDDGDACIRCNPCRLVVDHAQLHPEDPGADGHALMRDVDDLVTLAETVDDIDRDIEARQRGMAGPPEYLFVVGIDRDDFVSV